MTVERPRLRGFYPEIEPYRAGMLRVSNVHEIYFEESGNPQGKPAVFVHGGPGGCTQPKQRRFFDPAAYRASWPMPGTLPPSPATFTS